MMIMMIDHSLSRSQISPMPRKGQLCLFCLQKHGFHATIAIIVIITIVTIVSSWRISETSDRSIIQTSHSAPFPPEHHGLRHFFRSDPDERG
ncbi:hypothetical protein BDV25DRAFT_157164 [Aspergillus avenaceus]|uniref:Uncharacterized protein n=1 Tax=Aspergillus avenaceus TaxID=36643 RepID=A0A5N6TS46_ASPAV|nr:hypothetical protein BDV25DRAFT_157164 [Aspergillus avenaceus]